MNLPLGTKREAKVAFLNLALGEATTSSEILSESTRVLGVETQFLAIGKLLQVNSRLTKAL